MLNYLDVILSSPWQAYLESVSKIRCHENELHGTWGRIFSRARPLYEQAVSDLDP